VQRAILKKGPARNKKAGGWKGTIELLLIIAGAIVVIILGFYGGSIVSPPLSRRCRSHKTQSGCTESCAER